MAKDTYLCCACHFTGEVHCDDCKAICLEKPNDNTLILLHADLVWCLGKLRGLGFPNEALEIKWGATTRDVEGGEIE